MKACSHEDPDFKQVNNQDQTNKNVCESLYMQIQVCKKGS